MKRIGKIADAPLRALVLGALLLLLGSEGVSAQVGPTDPRWQGWLGCWAPVGEVVEVGTPSEGGSFVCILPAAPEQGVRAITLVDSEVTHREHLVADGAERSDEVAGCVGMGSISWGADAQRLYRHAQHSCEGGALRLTDELSVLTEHGEWLRVQGASVGERGNEGTAVRVLRYRRAPVPVAMEEEMSAALRAYNTAGHPGRVGYGAAPDLADVAEATARLPEAMVEAWLLEQAPRMEVNAASLRWMGEKDIPEGIIDLVVALSYPDRFALNQATGEAEAREQEYGRSPQVIYLRNWDPWGYGYGYYDYGYRYGSRYGSYYPYGSYGWAPWQRPVIIVRGSEPSAEQPSGGRVIKGRGYTPGRTDAPAQPRARERDTSSDSRGSSSSSGATTRSSSGNQGSSTPSSTGRTARPKSD